MDEIPIDFEALSVCEREEGPSTNSAKLAPWQVRLVKRKMAQQLKWGLRIGDLAAGLNISETHFAKGFRNTVGIPPYEWFLKARMIYALRLLEETEASVTDIAAECGFSSHSHFSTAFSRAFDGATPARWRRKRRKELAKADAAAHLTAERCFETA